MLGENLEVEMRAKVEEPFKSDPAEGLVARAGASDGGVWSAEGQVRRRSLADHRVSTDALHAELSCAERLAAREECRVGVLPILQIDIAVSRTEHRRRQPRTVIERVAHPFRAELVVSESGQKCCHR